MRQLYSISLGCPKNRVDTERTLGELGRMEGGLCPVEEPEAADLVFINTCAFIAPAVEESVRVVLENAGRLAALPRDRRPLLVVAGCLVGRFGREDLAPDLPEADLLLATGELPFWPEQIAAALKRRSSPFFLASASALPSPAPFASSREQPRARLLSTGPSYAWLKVSEGCRQRCSFCTIPAIRGPLRSESAASLRDEAAMLLGQGVRELILAAQDLSAWGADLPDADGLPRLLEQLLPLPGLARLRLMYLYPSGVTGELLAFLKNAGPPLVPYFDIPLQHASPRILSRMGRPFAQDPFAVVHRVREFFPDAALRTSLIVGFPGETEEDFDLLCRFVRQARFSHVGVFVYQPEEGTPAARMKGRIPVRTAESRRRLLMEIQEEISGEALSAFVGQRLSILVDAAHGEWPGLHLGRAWFQAPEVDGVTYVSGPGVVPGALVEAEICEASVHDLVALTEPEAC